MAVLTEDYLIQLAKREGGWVNDPDDSGGETNRGITLTTYKHYASSLFGSYSYTRFKNMTDNDWRLIVKQIWNDSKASLLNSQAIAIFYFDFFFGSYDEAWEYLSQASGFQYQVTLSQAIKNCNNSSKSESQILSDYYSLRVKFYYNISRDKDKKFYEGWIYRADKNLQLANSYLPVTQKITMIFFLFFILFLLYIYNTKNKLL